MAQQLEHLAATVAAQVLLDAIEASKRLTELGVPHALIGGLAVGMHGHPRATKDVDFLVGDEAFDRTSPLLVFREELRDLVRVGVIDLLPLPEGHRELSEYLSLPESGDIPVIGPEGLILLKLLANRPQDRADISALLDRGISVAAVTSFLRRNASELLPRFAEIVAG
ncbi:MAG: hypothetical protein ABI780_09880 [Ardenticatenales bacterium]